MWKFVTLLCVPNAIVSSLSNALGPQLQASSQTDVSPNVALDKN